MKHDTPLLYYLGSVVLLFVSMQNKQKKKKKVLHKIRNQHAVNGVQCTFRQTTQTQKCNLIFCCYSTVKAHSLVDITSEIV